MSGGGSIVDHLAASTALLADLPAAQLVPGDLAALELAATGAEELADQLASTARAIDYIELSGADWTGLAADAYAISRENDTTLFKRSSRAFDDAATALRDYARELVTARGQAEKARHDYREAARRQRVAAHAPAATGAAVTVGPPPPDPFGIGAAVTLLVEARHGVELAAHRAAQSLHDAARLAPDRSYLTRHEGPPGIPFRRLLTDVIHAPGHLAHGLGSIGTGTAEGLSTTDSTLPVSTKRLLDERATSDISAGLAEAGPATITVLSTLLTVGDPEALVERSVQASTTASMSTASTIAEKLPELHIDPSQLGRKWGKHAVDYGYDAGDATARRWYEDRLDEVRHEPDEIREGAWRPSSGGGTDYLFYRQGRDLLITKPDGTFVSMFPMEDVVGWFRRARVISR